MLGKEHLDTLYSAYCLSIMLAHRAVQLLNHGVAYQSKYEEAESLARRALDGREKALGREHRDTDQRRWSGPDTIP